MASKKIFVLYLGIYNANTTFYTNSVLVKIIQIFGMKWKRRNGILLVLKIVDEEYDRRTEQ